MWRALLHSWAADADTVGPPLRLCRQSVLSWAERRCSVRCEFFVNPRPHMLFSHPRTHMGGGVATPPHAISHLIEIELWDKDQTNLMDVLNLMVSTIRVDLFRSYLDPSSSLSHKHFVSKK